LKCHFSSKLKNHSQEFPFDFKSSNLNSDIFQVSQLNYNAIIDFFKKFPEYSNNEFFLSGESYGGISVATLSIRILEGNTKINFQVQVLIFSK